MYEHYSWLGWRASLKLRRWNRAWDAWRARRHSFDVVLLQRELFDDDSLQYEYEFRKLNSAFVLDIDDGIFLRHPEKFARLAAMADYVVAGNQLLAEESLKHNPRVAVIPTCIDLSRYQPKQHGSGSSTATVIGWTGTSSNLNELQLVSAALAELGQQHHIELHVVSDRPEPLQQIDFGAVPVRFVRWSPQDEITTLQRFDIGLMPLSDTEWAKYKCGFKIIQYMGIGIPAIASPVGVNSEIIQHGQSGFLAATSDEWHQHLDTLVRDRKLRRTMGQAGRRIVEADYSVQSQLPHLVQALHAAVEHRRNAK